MTFFGTVTIKPKHDVEGGHAPSTYRVAQIINFVLIDVAEKPVGRPKTSIDIGDPALNVLFPDTERVQLGQQAPKAYSAASKLLN
jgi:hypothetical protein